MAHIVTEAVLNISDFVHSVPPVYHLARDRP
jgi:hypothetical protein